MKEHIDFKTRAAYTTAIVSFVAGWGMTIAGFIVPPLGDVSNGVLAILGEAMIYTASVFGVTLYFHNQMERLRNQNREYIDRAFRRSPGCEDIADGGDPDEVREDPRRG